MTGLDGDSVWVYQMVGDSADVAGSGRDGQLEPTFLVAVNSLRVRRE